MSTLSLRLPESLHKSARALAKKEKVSINQLVTLALAEKVAALGTEDYLEKRARRASEAKFNKAMAKVAKVGPPENDQL
jgi:hypothetical protein